MDRWVVESVRSVQAFDGDGGKDDYTRCVLDFTYESLPVPPVTPDAPLAGAGTAWSVDPNDGVDRIGSLPDQILQNIVSRLPAKDAVRTGALAARWRGLWRSVPLVFVDAHLLPGCQANPIWRPGLKGSLGVTNAVSAVLAAHPGPFRCVHLTCNYMDLNREDIKGWLNLLATKGIQELAFINRPYPLDIPLPTTLFRCTLLTRLHIGAWKFPDTTALPRAAAFPHLKELFFSLIVMKDRDLAFLLDRSPVLEVLTIIASKTDVRMCLISRSLRCLQLGMTSLGDIDVAEAPRLERLVLFSTLPRRTGGNKFSRIKIGNAPNLRMLGYWQPGQHELQIDNAVVQVGSTVSPSTIVSGVQILALEMHFEVRNEVKMLPLFLKCFPSVETLHINSMEASSPTGKVNFKFWQESGSVECVERHVKKLIIHGLQGKKSEVAFLKFIAEKAQMLEKMVLILSPVCFYSVKDLKAKLNPLTTAQWASEHFKVIVFLSSDPEGGPAAFCFRIAADFSCNDPFDVSTVEPDLSGGTVFLSSINLSTGTL